MSLQTLPPVQIGLNTFIPINNNRGAITYKNANQMDTMVIYPKPFKADRDKPPITISFYDHEGDCKDYYGNVDTLTKLNLKA